MTPTLLLVEPSLHAFAGTLAYRPLFDPLPLNAAWPFLLIPLAVLLSMVYKAVRVPNREDRFDLGLYARHAGLMSLQVIAAIAGLYLFAVLMVSVLLPTLT